MNKILVVEDDKNISDILVTSLAVEGYDVEAAFNGKTCRELIKKNVPDLILLDVNLPDESGFDICKYINSDTSIPVIMLTARNDIFDKVLGLELGADDYITKPFHIREVLTRVRIALRRVKKYSKEEELKFVKINDNIEINYKSRLVLKNGQEVILKPKEYDLLEFLSQNKNRVFSREELLDNVWEFTYDGELRTIDIHVRRLRSKLDSNKDKSVIDTVFGVGYVLRSSNEDKV